VPEIGTFTQNQQKYVSFLTNIKSFYRVLRNLVILSVFRTILRQAHIQKNKGEK
jgi:hypothetical protein